MPYIPNLYTTPNSTVSTSVHELVINTWYDFRTVLRDRAEGKRLLLWYIYVSIYIPALTLRLLMSYIYGAPSKARNANVVYIWT